MNQPTKPAPGYSTPFAEETNYSPKTSGAAPPESSGFVAESPFLQAELLHFESKWSFQPGGEQQSELDFETDESESELDFETDDSESELDFELDDSESETDFELDDSESETDFELDDSESETDFELDDSESETDFELDDSESETDFELDDSESEADFELDDSESEADFELDDSEAAHDHEIDDGEAEFEVNAEDFEFWEGETGDLEFDSPGTQASQIEVETSPAKETYFVKNIPLGKEKPAKPLTGIFIPEGFKPSAAVDVLLYLHGMKAYGIKHTATCRDYWQDPRFKLRELLNASDKNAIMIMPTMGASPQREAGSLITKTGFDDYLHKVLAVIQASYPTIGNIGRIILAGHSAGGHPMMKIMFGGSQMAKKVVACWGFESMYWSSHTNWLDWLAADSSRQLVSFYHDIKFRDKPNYPRSNSKRLAASAPQYGLKNYTATDVKRIGHNEIPATFLPELLRNSFLLNK